MLLLPNSILPALSVAAGIVSHKLYWSRHEFDDSVPYILLGAILGHLALTTTFARQVTVWTASRDAALLEGIYATSVFASIAIYRLFFHPLKHYRGPFWARLTIWWKVKHIAQEGPHYALVNKLHQQYGDIVRTGNYVLLLLP